MVAIFVVVVKRSVCEARAQLAVFFFCWQAGVRGISASPSKCEGKFAIELGGFCLIVLFRADVLRTCLVGCCFLFGARLFVRIAARGKGVVCVKSRQVHIAAWQGRRSAEGCAVRTVLFLIVLFHAGVLRMCLVGCCFLFWGPAFCSHCCPGAPVGGG